MSREARDGEHIAALVVFHHYHDGDDHGDDDDDDEYGNCDDHGEHIAALVFVMISMMI